MDFLSTYNLKRWVAENQHLFNPPFRTNQLLVHHKDFLVMILRGPNTRLDFHIQPGDEFFYQVEGEMELVVKGVSGGCCGVSFPFVEVLLLIATSVAKQVATNRMTRFRWVFTRLALDGCRGVRYCP